MHDVKFKNIDDLKKKLQESVTNDEDNPASHPNKKIRGLEQKSKQNFL